MGGALLNIVSNSGVNKILTGNPEKTFFKKIFYMELYIIMKKSMMNIDNLFGLILAILIIFELNVENDMRVIPNSPYGIAISLVLIIVTFIFMNPIVGLLLYI